MYRCNRRFAESCGVFFSSSSVGKVVKRDKSKPASVGKAPICEMAIIEDVDSDSENDDIEADDDAEESNYAREERDFLARKEAAEAAENLKLRPARAARVALATVHKPPTRRRDWSSNPALNSYLRGNTKIADLPTDGSLTLQEVLKASQEVLTETQADLLVRVVDLCRHMHMLNQTYRTSMLSNAWLP